MASPSYTYTLTNATTADATQVQQNFTDILNGVTDGTKDLSISALTCAGTATFNGHVTLGNATADDITFTGSLASAIPIKTNNTYDIGASTLGLRKLYLGNGGVGATCDIISASHATTREYTIPDCSAAANFVMTQGNHTLAGAITVSGQLAGKGTATNDAGPAGYIGEVIRTSQQPSSASNTMVAGVAISTGLIELTPGDWDVRGAGGYKPGAGTQSTYLRLSISTVPNTSTADTTLCTPTSSGACGLQQTGAATAGQYRTACFPTYQVKVASSTSIQTLWFNVESDCSVNVGNAFGFLEARRKR